MRRNPHSPLLLLLLLVLPAFALADEAEDEAAIRKRVDSYVAAYNRGDAEALAEHWSEKAVYVNPSTGEQVEGRAAIGEMFKERFSADMRIRLSATVTSIRFVNETVAVEEGIARTVSPDQAPTESSYTAIHVKKGDQWYVDSIRETMIASRPSHHEKLKDLSWLIGEWVDDDDEATVRTKCQWTKNHNFITRSFSVSIKDRIEMEGTQVIGWDAASGTIRSWIFDTDGGFGQGVWTRKGNKWTIKNSQTLADGRRGAQVVIMTYLDDNTMTLQTITREVGGQILPNIEEFKVVKVQAKK